MQTRDGVRLDADVYIPSTEVGEGPWPVLLMRQPYGRAIASTIVYAHPSWYAAQGYLVIIQDVRGRGSSEGKFDLFSHEVADGEDTVRWAAQLPESDGQVGMYGFSYQGMTQLQAAAGCADSSLCALKAIAPAMTGYNLYADWAYENGAICLQLGLTWAIQLAAETARRDGDSVTYQTLLAASRRLPLWEEITVKPTVLSGIESFFHQWVANPEPGDYWQQLTPRLSNVDLPMLHIGGWFDPYLRGDLRLYREMSDRSQYPQPLCIGPWAHIPWSRRVGEVDFGPAAVSPIDKLQIRWFNHTLKGESWAEPRIQLFEMGRNQWRTFDRWPQATSKTYLAQSDGAANIREDSGLLVDAAGSTSGIKTSNTRTSSTDTLVHDPWNPAPALGGHSAIPAGSFERTSVDARGDVLTYTSHPLKEAIRVVGIVKVQSLIAASTPSHDLCAVLSRVEGSRVYNLTQGYIRMDEVASEPHERGTVAEVPYRRIELPLHPTCFSLAAGDRLRLSLSAACFPAYPVNVGTGAQPAHARGIDAQLTTLVVALEGHTNISLPVVPC